MLDVPLWSKAEAQAEMQERVRLHRAVMGAETPPEGTPVEHWTTWKDKNKRCERYYTFGKQQLCPDRL